MDTANRPWEVKAMTEAQEQAMMRDWGYFFKQQNQLDKAELYYNRSLEMRSDDPETLYSRSVCKRHLAKTKGALRDAMTARDLFRKVGGDNADTAAVNAEICYALYELNKFEHCKIEFHDNARKFTGNKVDVFNNGIIVIDENLADSLGDNLGPFIAKNEKYFPEVLRRMHEMNNVDPRPLWKILKEQGKCDVLSIMDKEDELLSPLEMARRARSYNVFHQMYMNRTWKDILFLKNLRKNSDFLQPYFKESTPKLRTLAYSKYAIVRNFAKMLHARSPMYNELAVRCPVKAVSEKHHEDYMYRVQYQTRRNMLTILKTMRDLRVKNDIETLSQYVEKNMGDYVVVKTSRAMPWKFEFLYEVYNLYGLAHVDQYKIPKDLMLIREKERLITLLHINMELYADRTTVFKFGDKSTYVEPDAVDHVHLRYKKFLRRMDKRLYFAKHAIEKSYIHHESGCAHLKRARFNECVASARKGMEDAKACKSHLWHFLNAILIVKSHSIQGKIERCKEALDEAREIITHLNDTNLSKFIEMCLALNKIANTVKKSQSAISVSAVSRSRTSRYTNASSVEDGESSDETNVVVTEFATDKKTIVSNNENNNNNQ